LGKKDQCFVALGLWRAQGQGTGIRERKNLLDRYFILDVCGFPWLLSSPFSNYRERVARCLFQDASVMPPVSRWPKLRRLGTVRKSSDFTLRHRRQIASPASYFPPVEYSHTVNITPVLLIHPPILTLHQHCHHNDTQTPPPHHRIHYLRTPDLRPPTTPSNPPPSNPETHPLHPRPHQLSQRHRPQSLRALFQNPILGRLIHAILSSAQRIGS